MTVTEAWQVFALYSNCIMHHIFCLFASQHKPLNNLQTVFWVIKNKNWGVLYWPRTNIRVMYTIISNWSKCSLPELLYLLANFICKKTDWITHTLSNNAMISTTDRWLDPLSTVILPADRLPWFSFLSKISDHLCPEFTSFQLVNY